MTIRAATIEELALLRAPGQATRLYLAGMEMPPVVFACVVNQDFPTHDRVSEIIYNAATGDYADVLPGMTVWIGSSAGKYDYGQARIRKAATADTIYIGEGSEINWANERHITVVDEMAIWPKHVYIDPDTNTVYMDRDVEYIDQHTAFDPVPIMGPDAVLDVSSYPATLRFPGASDSWVFDGAITTFAWTTTAGILTDADTADPLLTVGSYPANGLIRAALTVTADNGKSFTGYRYVHVYDAAHPAFTKFEVSNPSGDFESGGFSFDVTLHKNATRAEVRDRTPIILFARDWYGAAKQSIGQVTGRENIVIAGWVDGESINENPLAGTVTFTVQGPQFWMDKITGFPAGVEQTKKVPDVWTDMTALVVDRAVWHLLHWRSTLTTVCDIRLSGDARYADALASSSSTLWAQIKEIAYSSIFAVAGFNQYGMFYLFVHPQLVPAAERTWAVIQTLEKNDWSAQVDIRRRIVPETSMISLSGIALSRPNGKAKAYFSLSNGHVFKRWGRVEVIEKLLLTSQSQSNDLCGLVMGQRNSQYPELRFALHNNRMFTLFPAQFVRFDLAIDDTLRGIIFSRNFLPKSITYQWDAEKGAFTTELSCEAETFAELATDGDIPGVIEPGEIVLPPEGVEVIPPVPVVILPPTEPNTQRPRVVVLAGYPGAPGAGTGVYYTENGDEPDPAAIEWVEMNDGLADEEMTQIAQLAVTPAGRLYILANNKVLVSKGLGWPWELLFDGSTGYTEVIGTPSGCLVTAIGVNPNADDEIAVYGGRMRNYPDPGIYMVGLGGYESPITINPAGILWPREGFAAILYSDNGWIVNSGQGAGIGGSISMPHTLKFTADGALVSVLAAPGSDGVNNHYGAVAGTGDVCYRWMGVGGFCRVTSSGTVFEVLGISPTTPQAVAPSPTGSIIMASSVTTPFLSTDGGDTWESIADTVPIGPIAWENCRDENRWIFGGGTVIRFTADLGETYEEMEGNLSYIAPLLNVVFIRYIE